MTEQEAIKILNNYYSLFPQAEQKAIDVAVLALKKQIPIVERKRTTTMEDLIDKEIFNSCKPAFYSNIFDDLKRVAKECGWALGLHGSLANDMDIMAMAWTENATTAQELIDTICDKCFKNNPFDETNRVPYFDKPNNRVVYTIVIWKDFYLDINVIKQADTKRHAHWKRINDVLSQCSNCKTNILRCDTNNYCPDCGCKMDEVVE